MDSLPKRSLYQMMISQLRSDGFPGAAEYVARSAMIPPSSKDYGQRLYELSDLAIQTERERSGELVIDQEQDDESGLDFDKQKENRGIPEFITRFITTHKAAVRCARFTSNGMHVATGSEDCSLKLLDVQKMHYHHQTKAEVEDYASARPVIRTFYDHVGAINDIDFHPHQQYIITASRDSTVKLFDYTKASTKRAFKSINESCCVRSINMHPSGDYLLVGTDHNVVRTYDFNTFRCYASANAGDAHFRPINQVRYNTDGKLFVSGSKDGAVKIWDGVTGRCVNTIPNAHGGADIFSVSFSRNSKYLLSSGQDGTAKLWELSTGRQIRTYAHPTQPKHRTRVQTVFSCNEDLVLSSDNSSVVIWDTITGDVVSRLSGHNKAIRWIAYSPTEQAFMTCSEDARARFWAADEIRDN
eukprot:gb/GECH01000064.1/.p1 GENE.gb/GECH01000064.1/~~gb/GECH01000064.1/.p1  ORF type:complete len:414 (+),score=72.73 gb/GECH01000064.1/:1-1242(+)